MNGENELVALPLVCSVSLFENFLSASTFHQIVGCFNQICLGLQLDPSDYQTFYTRLKTKLTNWKALKLWTLLDKRASQKEYKKQKACQNLRVLIIGAGPCGLRMAIECALLGCKVVLLEKRDKFSRNNVLHIWPFVIQDLKNLGAKLFYPKFCAGSIDHISIKQLQCVLLKIALLLGVEVHENVSFVELLEPKTSENNEQFGWRAKVSPENHFVSEYEFDVLIGADGKRNTVPGFRRKEFRGKLAIAITANFVNTHTEAEERVPEISGVAFIFNQQFFKDMRDQTGVDLENIVYYKDETHYFVMTAKKQSLLEQNVILNDADDISMLLHPNNIDQGALMKYASKAADFATQGHLPHLDFAYNHSALPDVAMFDFTSLFSAENSCRLFERNGCRLLASIIGDSLHEPFWPTGSGCARGFLGVFDTAWMLKNYASSKSTPLDVLAARESVYRLLAQTTTENLNKNIQSYTIDPKTRYPGLELSVMPNQAYSLIDTDNPSSIDEQRTVAPVSAHANFYRRSLFDGKTNYNRHEQLIRWYQQIVQPFRLRVDNLTQSFRSGVVLNAVLHRFRPETTPDLTKLKNSDVLGNCKRAFDIIRSELGVDPPLSVCDRNLMYEYLFSIYEALKKESPAVVVASPMQRSVLKRKSPEEESVRQPLVDQTMEEFVKKPVIIEDDETVKERHRRRLENLENEPQVLKSTKTINLSNHFPRLPVVQTNLFSKRPTCVEKIPEERIKIVEKMFLENIAARKREAKPKKQMLKTRKLDQKEIDEMEEKLRVTAMGHLLSMNKPVEPNLTTQDAKIIAEKTAALKQKAEKGFREDEKYNDFDESLTNLDRKLRLPNRSGAVGVSSLLEQHSTNIEALRSIPVKKKAPVPLPHEKPPSVMSPTLNVDQQNNQQQNCYFCSKRVYLAEKCTVEGVSCHKACFRCSICNCNLRLNAYGMERLDIANDGRLVRFFFCLQHLNLNVAEKVSKLKAAGRRAPPSSDMPDVGVKTKTLIEFKPIPASATRKVLMPPASAALKSTALASLNSSFSVEVGETPERAEFEVSFIGSKENLVSGFDGEENNEDAEQDVEEKVEMHNAGFSMESLNRGATNDEFRPLNYDNDSDMDVGENDKNGDDEDESTDLSTDEESVLATVATHGLTYEEAAALAVNLKNRKERETTNDDISSMNGDEMSDTTESDEERSSDDVDSSKMSSSPKEKEPLKKKLTFSPPPPLVTPISVKLDETIYYTPAATNRSSSGSNIFQFETPKANLGTFDEFKTPAVPEKRTTKKMLYLNETPSESANSASGDYAPLQSPLRFAKMQEFERMREESRAKAKLKSDEELGMRFNDGTKIGDLRQELLHGSPKFRSKSVSQEVLPSPTKTLSTSNEDLTKRRAYSDESQHIHVVEKPSTLNLGEVATSLATPDSASSASKRSSSIISKFFNFASPRSVKDSNGCEDKRNHSANTTTSSVDSPLTNANVVSESAKETNLLGKIRLHKYNRNKARASSSPPKDKNSSNGVEQSRSDQRQSAPPSGLAPKATVDEVELSGDDSSPDVPVRSKFFTDKDSPAPRAISTATDVPGSASLMSLQSGDSTSINEKDIRRIQRAAAKLARQQEQKRSHKAQELQRSLQEVEVRRQQIENIGADVETRLKNSPDNNELTNKWSELISERKRLLHQEQILNLSVQDLELENEHFQLQQELRDRMNILNKSSKDLHKEREMLERCLDIVSRRDALITRLEEERLKEQREMTDTQSEIATYRNSAAVFLQSHSTKGGNSKESKPKSAFHSIV